MHADFSYANSGDSYDIGVSEGFCRGRDLSPVQRFVPNVLGRNVKAKGG